MRAAVLGAGGQLGHVVAGRARARGHRVTTWTRDDADITNPSGLVKALAEAAPEVVFNCAAFARVEEAEDEPATALAVKAPTNPRDVETP